MGAQRRSERKTLSWQEGDGRFDKFRSRSFWCSGDLRWKLDLLLWSRDQETEFSVEVCRLSETQEGKSALELLVIPFFDSTGLIYTEYSVEFLRKFRKRFRWKKPVLFKSGRWHFHQDNAPVHNSILVTDYLTKMGIKTVLHSPYSQNLAPCDF